jgi:hypothetical protein
VPRPFPHPLAAFRGPVACRRTGNALILTGAAAAVEDERLILTFIGAAGLAEVADSLADSLVNSVAAAEVLALDERHCRIVSAARSWDVEVTSVHVHHDVGAVFYRAIPPRPVPLGKRLLWRLVLALAATRLGKRLLLLVRGR